MQNILALDLSAEPSEALVVRIDRNRLKVLERHPLELIEEGENTPENGNSPKRLDENLVSVLSRLKHSWSSSYVVVPAEKYFPIEVSLPFRDQKSIERVVDLEVQDSVPFDTDQFLLATRVLDESAVGNTPVRVNLYPRDELRNLLGACKIADIEPYIVSTADSFAECLALLAPQYIADPSLIFLDHGDALYAVVIKGGRAMHSRVLRKFPKGSIDVIQDEAALLNEMRLSFFSLESVLGVPFEKIYLLNSPVSMTLLSQKLGREVEKLELKEFMDCSTGQFPSCAALGALFVQDEAPSEPLVNFRAREFSYSPQLKQFLRFARQLAPYLLLTFILSIIFLGTLYYAREYRIHELRSSLREQVEKVTGQTNFSPGTEVSALRSEIGQLNAQLADIGSAVQFSVLDSAKELTEIFSRITDRELLNVSIRGEHVDIEGNAPTHEHIKKIKEAFQKRKPVRCRIKEDTSTPAGLNRIRYTFRVECR